MSLVNARLVKCIKRILPVVKHTILNNNNNNRAIAFSNSKHSVLNSIRYAFLSNRASTSKSKVIGFLLLGLIELDEGETERQLIYSVKTGLLHLQNDDYNAFKQTLDDALRMAYSLDDFDGITYVYDVLANGAFINKDNEKAKDLFITVYNRLLDQGGLEDDLNIVQINLKISKIHEDQKDYKNSEYGYTYCIKLLEEKFNIDPENENVLALYSLSLDTYAHFLINQGQFHSACIYLKKAYDASVRLNGKVYEMNAILLNDLGSLSYILGKLDRALIYFKKAEEIGIQFPDMDNFSMVYINLGNIYLKQGMFKEAENHCKKGLKNAKKHHYEEGIKEAKICLAEINNATK